MMTYGEYCRLIKLRRARRIKRFMDWCKPVAALGVSMACGYVFICLLLG